MAVNAALERKMTLEMCALLNISGIFTLSISGIKFVLIVLYSFCLKSVLLF
jgi:hypothetical protein